MGDWNLPKLPDPYADFLDSLKSRDLDAISLGGFPVINPINGMIRYDRPANLFQELVAGVWQTKVLSVAGGGTGSNTPAGGIANLGLGTMAVQNANNVNISGGSINGLGVLTVAGGASIGLQLGVGGQLGVNGRLDVQGASALVGKVNTNDIQCAHLQAENGITVNAGVLNCNSDVNVAGTTTLSGQVNTNNIHCGNLTAAGAMFTVDITVSRNAAVVGTLYSGPGGMTVITNAADGRVYASAIGAGYTGGGTRVLTDNGNWVEQNLIGGGVREVVHNNMSFGTDELVKDIVIPWNIMPISAKNWHLQFDQPYSDNSSTNGGPIFYSVTYLGPNQARITRTIGPGAVQPILATTVVYTAFHHRTEVN